MEKRTEAEIIHDMEGIIFTRANKAQRDYIRNKTEGDARVWNEYRALLYRLDLLDEYEEMYG